MQNLQRLTITEDGVTDDYYRASEVDIMISESIAQLEKTLNCFADKRISMGSLHNELRKLFNFK